MNRFLPRRTFRLQYASNLFAYTAAWKPEQRLTTGLAPYLALLGNVVSTDTDTNRRNSREFLSFCADNWKQTFLIPATTELGSSWETVWTDALDNLMSLVNSVNTNTTNGKIYIADQGQFQTPERVRVLGITGWNAWSRSAVSPTGLGFPPLYRYSTEPPIGVRRIDPSNGHELSKEDMEWLNGELIADSSTPTVLLSHGLSTSSLITAGLPQPAYNQSAS